MKKREPRPGEGRPTKYKPEYCEQLIKHMAMGLSYETFGATINVAQSTVYLWEKHPEFSEAKKEGFDKSRLFWERLGTAGAMGKIKNFNVTAWIFSMKNRFKWTDRLESNVNHGGQIEIPAVKFIVESPNDDDEKC